MYYLLSPKAQEVLQTENEVKLVGNFDDKIENTGNPDHSSTNIH